MLEGRIGDDPHVRAEIDEARGEIAESLEELARGGHGIHPAVVTGHGLAVGLQSLVARAPVPVRLKNVDLDERVSERLEVAAYYVVSESLANIGKHAEATRQPSGLAGSTASSWSRSSTMGLEAPTQRAALASRPCRPGGSPRWATSSLCTPLRRRYPRAGGDPCE